MGLCWIISQTETDNAYMYVLVQPPYFILPYIYIIENAIPLSAISVLYLYPCLCRVLSLSSLCPCGSVILFMVLQMAYRTCKCWRNFGRVPAVLFACILVWHPPSGADELPISPSPSPPPPPNRSPSLAAFMVVISTEAPIL